LTIGQDPRGSSLDSAKAPGLQSLHRWRSRSVLARGS
jgi:hypothetical protein